ncbi:HAD family hydrolase [Halorubrum xinjiangense]|uniref:HAD family hydrolase n=1 Tax=Halorubrum xinjiangense TaxID=261291 RepID=UPI003C6F17AA
MSDGDPESTTAGSRLAGYDAVVYDLDGTLVELAVDWDAVADAVLDVYAEHALIPPTEELWDLLGAADDYGIRDEVEAAIADHERPGARESALLPLGDRLTGIAAGADAGSHPPAGVCSLNCEEACRIAADTHGLDDALVSDAIVGRDTVETHKPDPASLLAAIDRLGAAPENALFVGDSQSDAVTAERGGVDFAWVSDLLAE